MSRIGVKGGMALTSSYRVYIQPNTNDTGGLSWYTTWKEDKEWIEFFCDETQLPNIQAQTAMLAGRVLGEGQFQYPHTRIHSDLSMSFMCDADMTPMKFFTAWHNYIFFGAAGDETGYGVIYTDSTDPAKVSELATLGTHKSVRLSYPDQYTAKIRVVKTELGTTTNTDRASIGFVLQDAYPYSVDTVPLAYGSSQLTKVTVNFYYKRHDLIFAG